MAGITPSDELVAASFSVASVVAVFGNYTASVNDTASDQPNAQNHNDTKRAAIVSTAIVSGVSILSKSPTVATLGFAVIVLESWVRYHANYTTPKNQG